MNHKKLLRISGGFAYDPAAVALFAAFTGTYSNTVKDAINTAIVGLKASGAWDDFDVLYPIAGIPGVDAANATDSKLNWKAPGTFTLTEVNAPTHGNGYWQGNGVNSRLRTQFTPTTNAVKMVQDSASLMLWSVTAAAATAADMGNTGVAPLTFVRGNDTGFMSGRANIATTVAAATATGVGLTMIQRRGATDSRIFRDGVEQNTNAGASTTLPTQEQWVCGANSAAFSARRINLAAWGASQSGREASIYSVFLALFTALGTI